MPEGTDLSHCPGSSSFNNPDEGGGAKIDLLHRGGKKKDNASVAESERKEGPRPESGEKKREAWSGFI